VTPLKTGDMVGSRYRIVRQLGSGGMGAVYLAKAVGPAGFEKSVALKVAHADTATEAVAMEMFLSEARLSARLQHANVAQVYDLGVSDALYFIAMEYVRGVTLRDLIAALRQRQARMPVPILVAIMKRLLEGLDHAHELRDDDGAPLKLVHRDVSPVNCMLSYGGEVKLIDFGIAKAVGQLVRTRTGIVRGKLSYMSPEQVRGQPLDRRSDIFAAGVVMYELLVGRRPFEGDGAELVAKLRKGEFPKPRELDREVPIELEAAVLRALAIDRNRRFETAGKMQDVLERYLMANQRIVATRELAAFVTQIVPPDDVPANKEHTAETTGFTDPP
jgi:eukaryotic-like serine/threonine-protein kinase